LNHLFAFITFKDCSASARVVNELPYLKQKNQNYNKDFLKLVEIISKLNLIEERHHYRFACYLIELDDKQDFNRFINDKNALNEQVEPFKKYLQENDDNYVVKDKEDRIECCQALKKRERLKKLKILFEKIKKQIKEKIQIL